MGWGLRLQTVGPVGRGLRLPRAGLAWAGPDPAERVVTGFATAAYRYEVALRVQATPEHLRVHLPATVATLEDTEPG